MNPGNFVQQLKSISLDCVFNPYSDRCSAFDLKEAPARRSAALASLLTVAEHVEVDSLWVGRDLGYRGGRRTGLALTDDIHVSLHAQRWNLQIERATKGQPQRERTAAVIWKSLSCISVPTFLWNVFPFHPHEPGDPFTNRAHSSREREIGEQILAELVWLIRPRRIIAIGNNAAASVKRLCTPSELLQVRHPSYGGQNEFVAQIENIYGLERPLPVPSLWS